MAVANTHLLQQILGPLSNDSYKYPFTTTNIRSFIQWQLQILI